MIREGQAELDTNGLSNHQRASGQGISKSDRVSSWTYAETSVLLQAQGLGCQHAAWGPRRFPRHNEACSYSPLAYFDFSKLPSS